MKASKSPHESQPKHYINSLFMKWLSELKDDAAQKELKTQYSYAKALRSLTKYPLPLQSGKECKVLDGFGNKICEMLDSRLSKHIAENGNRNAEGNEHAETAAFFSVDSGSDREGGTAVNTKSKSPVGKRRQRSTSTKGYIPRKNSGAYALLLTLHKLHEETGGSGHMLKRQLMAAAQPLSEQSFTIPDPGSHYTAWSSMGTLINKGLVARASCPAKYHITTFGCELAKKLVRADAMVDGADCLVNPERVKNNATPTDNVKQHVPFASHFELRDCQLPPAAVAAGMDTDSAVIVDKNRDWQEELDFVLPEDDQSHQPRLHFVYIDFGGNEVLHKDAAAVTVDDDISVGFLGKFKHQSLVTSGLRYKLDTSRLCSGNYVYAYLHDGDAPEVASPETSDDNRSEPRTTSHVRSCSLTLMDVNSSQRSLSDEQNSEVNVPAKKPRTVKNPAVVKESTATNKSDTELSRVEGASDASNRWTLLSASTSATSSQVSAYSETSDSQSSSNMQTDIGKEDFLLPPGTFRVLLCVDNQEFYAKGLHNKEMLIKELDRLGVNYEVRRLNVGDFLWVAQHVTDSGEKIELVLDYIVERKRMDDLADSIVDGRFREQKHRLRNCGLSNVIYLVEEYGSMEHFKLPAETLNQAIINTQIADGFSVKKTSDTRQSAAYLFLMTRYLQSLYSSYVSCCWYHVGYLAIIALMPPEILTLQKKTLYGYKRHLCASDVASSPTDHLAKLMSFPEFSEASIKTRPLSVSEMFAKQLMQLHGLTAEKAAAVVDKYSTPSALFEAYTNCSTEKERNVLLAELKFGPTKRNFGLHLSKMTAMLYHSRDPLP